MDDKRILDSDNAKVYNILMNEAIINEMPDAHLLDDIKRNLYSIGGSDYDSSEDEDPLEEIEDFVKGC